MLSLSAERLFLPLSILLLAGMAAVQISSARDESQTWDEAMHLAAGYSYWKTGDFRLNPEHPPLGKLMNALPLLWMDLRLPLDHPSWREAEQREFGLQFLYYNRAPADEILFRGRLPTILASAGLGAAIAWWTRLRFGAAAALVALAFYAFDPNFIAHGRYVTSDVWVSLFSFLACALAAECLLTGARRYLWLAGASLGLALASKFSALFLFFVFPALWWLKRRRDGWPGMIRTALEAATVAATAALVLALVYAPEMERLLPAPESAKLPRLADKVTSPTAYGQAVRAIGHALNLPELTLPVAVGLVLDHDRQGHPSYLRGKVREKGRWHYFPAAFAVKAPTALLIALAFAAALFLRRRPNPLGFEYWALLAPLGVYLWVGMGSGINIGIRHLLPALPFVFVFIGAELTRSRWVGQKIAVGGFLALLAVESLSIYPHYLAFFNWPSGGPANGRHWLVDSNLDWGQDLIRLKRYVDRHGIRDLAFTYFGTAPPVYYGIPDSPAPTTAEVGNPPQFDGIVAVSVTPLQGVYVPPEDFSWLRDREPATRIGYSIHIYDFRKNKDSRSRTR